VKARKAHSLTGRITNDLMIKAFKAVRKNRGAAGIDKVSISMFERQLDKNLAKLMKDLKAGVLEDRVLRKTSLGTPRRAESSPPCWLTSSSTCWTRNWPIMGISLSDMLIKDSDLSVMTFLSSQSPHRNVKRHLISSNASSKES